MNYRHAFHAGGFADVVKHAVLVRILLHLRAKPAGFRFIDSHAGAGLYDLAGPEATRSREWRAGIERLFATPIGEAAQALLAPYLAAVADFNPPGRLLAYPGSPVLARALLRPQDRLTACELEPAAAAALARNLAGDHRSKVLAVDGWSALRASLPPVERRGMVLIDPSFEEEADHARLADALAAAYRKWSTGSYMLWHPIKARETAAALARRFERSAIGKVLRAELRVAVSPDDNRLAACCLILVNPPWTLESELAVLLPELAAILSDGRGGSHRLEWLAREK